MIELEMDHKHEQHNSEEEVPCHPHRQVQLIDYSSIEEQIEKIRRKKELLREAAQQFKRVKKEPQQIYGANVMEEAFNDSIQLLPEHVSMALRQRVKFIEDKVYIGSKGNVNHEYIERVKNQQGEAAVIDSLNLMMQQIQVGIEGDIEEGNYQIRPVVHAKKSDIQQIQPPPAQRLRINNKMLRSKLVQLRSEFDRSEVRSQIIGSSEKVNEEEARSLFIDEYNIKSEKTKKAKKFIKKIQQQQLRLRKKKEQKKLEMQSLEVKSMTERIEFENEMKKEKHQQLKRKYEEGRREKQDEKQRQQKIREDYMKFLSQYKQKKPLFKKKEEQYAKQVTEKELQRRKMQLMAIRESKKPMNRQEFIEHEKQYLKWKEEKLNQLKEEKSLKRKEEGLDEKKNYFRGKFHAIIMEELQKEDQQVQIDTEQLRKKRREYSERIKKQFFPRVNELKRKELEELIGAIQRGSRNQKELPNHIYRQLGNQYLKDLHVRLSELRKLGKIKEDTREIKEQTKRKDYLRQVREKYNLSSIDYEKQMTNNRQWVEGKAMKMEREAMMRQKIMTLNKKDNFDLERHMRQLEQINEDYIQSAQVKLKLLGRNKERVAESVGSERESSKISRSSSRYQ